eukprot:TRINITY_DN62446_c0_g1_i1.p2 TRINITY_DN62446_c0_g1~~TRINITY_DN62446_c0_g1_i1.p2  ORF type:complete len:270 (-),score=59.11 TRINITY_DN62446_c0_g1_i1:117-860(-)
MRASTRHLAVLVVSARPLHILALAMLSLQMPAVTAKPPAQSKRARKEGDDDDEERLLRPSQDKQGGKGVKGNKLEERISRLEKIVLSHDTALRNLEANSMFCWLLHPEDAVGLALRDKMQEYNLHKPKSGPHPWGPARRCLGLTLIQLLIKSERIAKDDPFVIWHDKLKDETGVDKLSLNFMMVRETREELTLVKLRPYDSVRDIWSKGIEVFTTMVEEAGGERKTDGPPPGNLVREIMAIQRSYKK